MEVGQGRWVPSGCNIVRVIIACEQSGIVRDACASRGADAWSCDLVPAPGNHIRANVIDILGDRWDLMIAHPPCQYLSVSGLHWGTRKGRGKKPGRAEKVRAAISFAEALWHAPIEMICIENPVGILGTRSNLGKATQYIHPYLFGHDASKRTGLWLKRLPQLLPTNYILPRMVGGKKRWANQTDSGQNKLAPSDSRSRKRSETYRGIANAMAAQWINI